MSAAESWTARPRRAGSICGWKLAGAVIFRRALGKRRDDRVRKFSSGWILPGVKAGLFAALLSGLALYLVLLVFFRHLFTNTYDFMLAPILFVSHLSLILGCFGLAGGLIWRVVFALRRRRVLRNDARALCMSTCLAGAAAFFTAAWVAFDVLPGRNAGTLAGLIAVAAGAAGLVWVLYRRVFRRLLATLMPSNRGALALFILSAFGTVLGESVRLEYLTERPDEYVQEPAGPGAGISGEEGAPAAGAAVKGAAAAGGRAPARAGTEGRLNLLLITIDTLRADHLGCYGYSRKTSPSADSLAAAGVLFTRAYAQRPKTSPSFASILTGTYPQRHGVRRTKRALAGSAYTLAEALRDAGYRTCGVVTNGNLFPAFGFDQGFDTYLYGHSGAQKGTEIALDWLRNDAAGPFLLWVHHTDPHAPYKPPARFRDMFTGDIRYGDRPLEICRGRDLGGVRPRLLLDGPLDLGYYISQYDGEIAYTDHCVGELLAGLRERGLGRSTLVVFTADHGESLGEHEYYFEHGLLPYEPSARIPLVVSLPGVTARGVREDVVMESVDIMPTVLELLGVGAPASCQGESIVETALSLTDPDAEGTAGAGSAQAQSRASGGGKTGGASGSRGAAGAEKSGSEARARGAAGTSREEGAPTGLAYVEAGYGHHTGPGYTFAMTDGRYKLVVRDIAWVVRPRHIKRFIQSLNALFEGGADRNELYDLGTDPAETENLIEELPEVAGGLREDLDAFLARMKSEGALPPDAKQRTLDEKTLRSLRALGYVN